jgi:hypothetical protein
MGLNERLSGSFVLISRSASESHCLRYRAGLGCFPRWCNVVKQYEGSARCQRHLKCDKIKVSSVEVKIPYGTPVNVSVVGISW